MPNNNHTHILDNSQYQVCWRQKAGMSELGFAKMLYFDNFWQFLHWRGANESNSGSNFLKQEDGRVDHNRQNLLKLLPSSPLLRRPPSTKGGSCKTTNVQKKRVVTSSSRSLVTMHCDVPCPFPQWKVGLGKKVCKGSKIKRRTK